MLLLKTTVFRLNKQLDHRQSDRIEKHVERPCSFGASRSTWCGWRDGSFCCPWQVTKILPAVFVPSGRTDQAMPSLRHLYLLLALFSRFWCARSFLSLNSVGNWRNARILPLRGKDTDEAENSASNVLGTPLECCCADVRNTGVGTGFYRNGYCSTGDQDVGRHTVCVQVRGLHEILSWI